ncbi:594_t:CDS:2 [Dentiscutata heterogama]|uniref:594_t:CDS:1 n=1 Tax=Dentiscutata heterogama TaxID=1316150 RepID=A0ACA9PGI4_9GLOM|nr:594_t:CDS:2 [Dentiscutata heterogama]
MNNAFHRTPSLSVARSHLNILMKNIESANVDVEEIVEDNEYMLESRETFVQVLQAYIHYAFRIIKVLITLSYKKTQEILGQESRSLFEIEYVAHKLSSPSLKLPSEHK